MSPIPAPASGPDGDDVPLPGAGARDGNAPGAAPGGPPCGCGDDWDGDAELARFIAEVDAGRIPIPPEDERAPAVMFTFGEAADVDPAVLAAMAGPDGLGGQVLAQDRAADAMPPGPLLAALAENAAADLGALTHDELFGVVAAARRLQNRGEYLELAAIAEFTGRSRAPAEAGARPGRRTGEFADAELGMELVISARAAGDRMDLALDLATRLPATFAGLAAGVIDGGRVSTIWYYTRFLSAADAAGADKILAAAAPHVRPEGLARKAAALEMKLDPDGAKQRKEHARRDGRRVEARREPSGNMAFGARELAVTEALAARAVNDADAAALRRAGMPGTLRELRVLAYLDRLAGRNPLDRLTPAAAPASPVTPGPVPAMINLLVPAGTLLGWSTAPGDAGGWGLLDPGDTRSLVRAASQHPATRWCVTVIGPDGTAVAHGCSRGRHPWPPAPQRTSTGPAPRRTTTGPGPPGPVKPSGPPGPDEHQQAQLAALLRTLNVTLAPVAAGSCDHRHRQDRYTPGRILSHLVRARTATCPAPGCGARAVHCDLDHTIPWPAGPTDQCNLGPPCRRHHRVKQAPGWRLDQPEPGVMRWTTPSGRVHTTTPTVYDL